MARERAEDDREFGAWEGDRDRLLAVADRVRRVCEPKRDEDLERMRERLSPDRDRIESGSPAAEDAYRSVVSDYARREMEETAKAWQVKVTAKEEELNYTRSGEPEDIIAGLDPKRVHTLEVRCPGGSSLSTASCVVKFSRDDGCRLYVTGDDRDWVQGTLATVSDELKRNVPVYAPLRHDRMIVVLTVLIALPAALALSPEQGPALGVAFGLLAPAFFVAVLVHQLVKRYMLPGFEVVTGQPQSRGYRALAWLGTVTVSVIGSYLLGGIPG